MVALLGLVLLILIAAGFVYFGLAALSFLVRLALALFAGVLAGGAVFGSLNWVASFSRHPNIRGWAFAGDWVQALAGLAVAMWVTAAVWSALSAGQS